MIGYLVRFDGVLETLAVALVSDLRSPFAELCACTCVWLHFRTSDCTTGRVGLAFSWLELRFSCHVAVLDEGPG